MVVGYIIRGVMSSAAPSFPPASALVRVGRFSPQGQDIAGDLFIDEPVGLVKVPAEEGSEKCPLRGMSVWNCL